MSSVRDKQRSRVYAAECELPTGLELPTVTAMQRYVDKITRTRWWHNRVDNNALMWSLRGRVLVTDGRARYCACARQLSFEIAVPRWCRNERTLLHELAHLLTTPTVADHGPEFAYNFLQLIRRFFNPSGDYWARRLRESYKTHKVRYYRRKRND